MIHPSYTDLMRVVNSNVEEGEEPLVNSRYSIVLATAKRAKQIIKGSKPLVDPKVNKPLSIAVQEVYEGKVKILPDESGKDDEVKAIYDNNYASFAEIEELGENESESENENEDGEDEEKTEE